MNRAIVIVLMCGMSAMAQPRFSAPFVGIARDSKQQLRIVDGVSGTFVLRDTISEGTIDWAFDGKGGLVKTGAELLTLGTNGAVVQHQTAPQKEVVLGPQGAFFPETAKLWVGEREVSIDPSVIVGSVIALGPVQGHDMQLAVCRSNEFWLISINTANGGVTRESQPGGAVGKQACLSPASGSLVLLADRMLLATTREILIQTAAGAERSIPISTNRLTRAGAQWVEAEGAGQAGRMIRINAGGEQVYLLPAAKERP